MDTSDVIASLSLAISLVTACGTYLAYRKSVRERQRDFQIALSREQSELMVRIERARDLFDHVHGDLQRVISSVEGLTDAHREPLRQMLDQLLSDLRHLEGCQRQANALWHEVYDMQLTGLAHHKPRFLKLIEDDEAHAAKATARSNDLRAAAERAPKGFTMFFVGP